ncbi:MAG: desulfoferrodoxin FeS4 iron-binding domain-containing protein [Candidatus Omnitrophica bacterium]|nr:desulfoferrodoxin FeS4 iron-binding domain-containing protein [Candidatus Omnitrophota bacterium]
MTQLRELYRCEVCGNVVEIVNEGQPALVCCDQPMKKLEAKTEDEGQEKHVPVVEDEGSATCTCDSCGEDNVCIKVKVGSTEHPMTDEHYIKCIEVLTKDSVLRKELKPGDKPEAHFCCVSKDDIAEVREFCTVHMLWKNSV